MNRENEHVLEMNAYGWQWQPLAHVMWNLLVWLSIVCAYWFRQWEFLIVTAALFLILITWIAWIENPHFE
jgi:hypothetical protein